MSFREDYDWSEVVNPMTDDEIREWIVALKSKKYEQSQGNLQNEEGYCCLGVEQEIHKVECESDTLLKTYARSFLHDIIIFRLPGDLQDRLSRLNDEGETFETIAKFLKEGFNL